MIYIFTKNNNNPLLLLKKNIEISYDIIIIC